MMNLKEDILFTPVTIGKNIKLQNRIVMAPLTRNRSVSSCATELHAEYYAQRATAGLIITEATMVSPLAKGYFNVPGIYNSDQTASWKLVTKAVHEAGGKIFCQIWHTGRIAQKDLMPEGEAPIAPSALVADAKIHTGVAFKPATAPRALEITEIPQIVEQYRTAAMNAIEAGFDGVEIHGANGYLIDNFLCDIGNIRTDEYGGSKENRARFLREVVGAVTEAIGSHRTALRISPFSKTNHSGDSDPMGLFSYVFEMLNPHNLAYLHVIEGDAATKNELPSDWKINELYRLYQGTIMVNNGYRKKSATQVIGNNGVELVSFGVPYIANADLVERFKTDAPLNKMNGKTLFGGGAEGYTDYPTLKETVDG